MAALEGKLKTICERLNEEKQIYLQDNKKMAEELLEIKGLLVKIMGDAVGKSSWFLWVLMLGTVIVIISKRYAAY